MDPLQHLVPAIYTTLSASPLAYGGEVVPVFQHLAKPRAGHYVRLHQKRAPQVPGSRGCLAWSCSLLIDVVTQFPTPAIDTIPADRIAAAILTRLHQDENGEYPILPMPDNWQCGPASLDMNEDLDDPDTELFAYRRLLRLRWPVYYHVPASPQPEPDGELLALFGIISGPFPHILV